MTPQDHIVNIFPTSLIKSMAENDVLQIVVFSLIFAIGVSAIGEKGRPMMAFCESLAEAMFKFTNYVMLFAPYGVGAAMAGDGRDEGLIGLKNLALLIFTLYGALLVFILLVLLPVALMARVPIKRFLRSGQRTGAAGLHHYIERVGVSEGAGKYGTPRCAASHRQFYPATRL
jgi:proton glutamate symport protein